MFAGDSKRLPVQVFVDDTSTAKNILGATVRWVLSDRRQQIVIDKRSDGASPAITITDAAAGRFDIAINPSDTEMLAAGLYRQEAELTDAGGEVSTVFTGEILIRASKA